MKNKIKNLIIILLLGFSIVFNGYLFIENKNKATTIVQLIVSRILCKFLFPVN